MTPLDLIAACPLVEQLREMERTANTKTEVGRVGEAVVHEVRIRLESWLRESGLAELIAAGQKLRDDVEKIRATLIACGWEETSEGSPAQWDAALAKFLGGKVSGTTSHREG